MAIFAVTVTMPIAQVTFAASAVDVLAARFAVIAIAARFALVAIAALARVFRAPLIASFARPARAAGFAQSAYIADRFAAVGRMVSAHSFTSGALAALMGAGLAYGNGCTVGVFSVLAHCSIHARVGSGWSKQ